MLDQQLIGDEGLAGPVALGDDRRAVGLNRSGGLPEWWTAPVLPPSVNTKRRRRPACGCCPAPPDRSSSAVDHLAPRRRTAFETGSNSTTFFCRITSIQIDGAQAHERGDRPAQSHQSPSSRQRPACAPQASRASRVHGERDEGDAKPAATYPSCDYRRSFPASGAQRRSRRRRSSGRRLRGRHRLVRRGTDAAFDRALELTLFLALFELRQLQPRGARASRTAA